MTLLTVRPGRAVRLALAILFVALLALALSTAAASPGLVVDAGRAIL